MKSEGSESHVLAEVLSRVRRRVLKAELEGSTVNERPKTGSGKKFSISIQVPDDMATQWPDRSTAERLIEEIFRAMSGASLARPALARDGFKANILESGKLFIVYIGTFADQKDAARLANALRTHHYEVVVIAGPAQAAQN